MKFLSLLSLIPTVFGGKYYYPPTTTEAEDPRFPCTDNVRDSAFSCECFNDEPDTILNCPRTACVFDFYDDYLCLDLPSGGSGPIPNGDPIQCTLNGFDECEDVSVCIDSASIESYCVPDSSNGVDFGCCKNYPRANDDYESTTEPDSVTINPLLNDVDPDGDQLRIVDLSEPDNGGRVTPGLGDTLTYTPGSDRCRELTGFWNYQDEFTYTIADSDGLQSIGRIFIAVDCSRESPRAYDDDVAVNEGDENVSTDPLNGPGYDSDIDGDDDELIINRIVSGPSLGTARITSDNTDILYTPNEDACDGRGDAQIFDQFDYNVMDIEDDRLISNTATVFITIFCSSGDDQEPESPTLYNLKPNAVDDMINVDEGDQNVMLRVLENDSDPDGNPLTVIITKFPSLGSASIAPDGSDIIYTVDSNACYRRNSQTLTDEIFYTAFDGNLVSDPATITIYITCRPAPFVMPRRSSSSSGGTTHHHHGLFGLWGHTSHHGGSSSSDDGQHGHHGHGLIGGILHAKSHLWGGSHTTHHGGSSSSSSGRNHWRDFRDDREFEVVPGASRNKPLWGWGAQSVNDNNDNNNGPAVEGPAVEEPVAASPNTLNKFTSYIIIGIIAVLFNFLAYLSVYFCCIKKQQTTTVNEYEFNHGKVIDNDDMIDEERMRN